VFDAFCRGPQVLVGSSMGGWLALLLVRDLLRRKIVCTPVAGLALIAPAADFTRSCENGCPRKSVTN
jgi:alpha-beta hydrolase superfamily lysophospholipase